MFTPCAAAGPVAPNLQDQLLTECLHPRLMVSGRKVAFNGAAPLDVLLVNAREWLPEPCVRERRSRAQLESPAVIKCAHDLYGYGPSMWDYDIVGWLPDGLPDMTRMLLERGEAGWELVTVVPRDAIMRPEESKAEHWWIFKRPTVTDTIS